ncbi:distal tail protein Dit [Enterococcus gallinarum]|uniref:distal tail protein Dit n=1 Tax=Enterococcus gallinarum TaxID=1353 RepID=UPI0035D8F7A8
MTSFTFNDFDFSGVLLVNDIQRPLLPPIKNTVLDMASHKGVIFNYNSYGEKTLTVDITIVADTVEDLQTVKDTIARNLFVSEPKKLVFSDTPEKYYLAVPDGQFDIDQTLNIGQGTLTFLVPAGVAFANYRKKFPATLNSEGLLEVVVDNQGTEECPVDVEATFKSDNGVFAAMTSEKVIEVGSPTELDGHIYQQTDTVAVNTLRPDDKKNWIENSPDARTEYPMTDGGIANRIGEGSFDWESNYETAVPIFPDNPSSCWVGGTLYRTFEGNSNGSNTGNFDAIWRIDFGISSIKQAGREEVNLISSSNGDVVFAVSIRKSSTTSNALNGAFIIKPPDTEKYVHNFALDLSKIKGAWYEIRITRIGNDITFKMSNIKNLKNDEAAEVYFTYQKTFNDSRVGAVPISATTYFPHAKWRNAEVPKKLGLANFIFRWINVEHWADDPNRYIAGDVMYIDSVNAKVMLNSSPILNDVVKGSQYLTVPIGKSTLQFSWSDFAEVPDVSVYIQEVFL